MIPGIQNRFPTRQLAAEQLSVSSSSSTLGDDCVGVPFTPMARVSTRSTQEGAPTRLVRPELLQLQPPH